MQKTLMLTFAGVVALVVTFVMVGCEKTDERLYGRWQTDVEMDAPWNRPGGFGQRDTSDMTAEQQAQMESQREQLRNRTIIFEFTNNGTWSTEFVQEAGTTGGFRGPGAGQSGKFSITDKDESSTTLSLLQEHEEGRKLKVKYIDATTLQFESYEQRGQQQMKFGTFKKK